MCNSGFRRRNAAIPLSAKFGHSLRNRRRPAITGDAAALAGNNGKLVCFFAKCAGSIEIDTFARDHHDPDMEHDKPILTTIGYQGAVLEDFIATLMSASVRLLIDVRELPISRRKGFAKTALSAALTAADIQYLHLKGLGDPKPGRDAARAGDHAGFLKVFKAHLLTSSAQSDLKVAATHAMVGGACLMCYERDHTTCHRDLVAKSIDASVGVQIRNIGVRSGLAAANRVLSAVTVGA